MEKLPQISDTRGFTLQSKEEGRGEAPLTKGHDMARLSLRQPLIDFLLICFVSHKTRYAKSNDQRLIQRI